MSEIADLITNHTIGWYIKDGKSSGNALLSSSLSLDDYLTTTQTVTIKQMFEFKNGMNYNPAAEEPILQLTFYTPAYNLTVPYLGTDYTAVYNMMQVTRYTSGNTETNVRLGLRLAGGQSLVISASTPAYYDFDVDAKIELMVQIDIVANTGMSITMWLGEILSNGHNGQRLYVTFDIEDVDTTEVLYLRNYYTHSTNVESELILYEPCLIENSYTGKHRFFGWPYRNLIHTYYDRDNCYKYMFPPADIMAGAIDRVEILEDQIQVLEARLTAQRASNLDNIDNSNLGLIGDISSLTATKIGFLNNINNSNLLNIGDLSALTSARINFLDNINWSYLPSLWQVLEQFWSNYTTSQLSDMLTYWLLGGKGYTLYKKSTDSYVGFDITTSTTTGVLLIGFDSINTLLSSLNSAIQEWASEHEDLLSDAHLTLLSELAVPLDGVEDLVSGLQLPRIQQIILNDITIDFPTIEITFVDLVIRCLNVAFPYLNIPSFQDINIHNSDNCMFDDDSQYDKGYNFTPPRYYRLWQDLLGRDVVLVIVAGLVTKLIGKALGSDVLKTQVLKKLFNSKNINEMNDAVKTISKINTVQSSLTDVQSDVGTSTDLSTDETLFGKVAEITGKINQISSKMDSDLIDDIRNLLNEIIGLKLKF